ncbi:hypothetical protein IGK51_002285 [Enterococcus sp. DIV0098]
MKRISKYLLEQINYCYLFFVGLTFFGAIRSKNLNISELPHMFVFFLFFSVIILFIILAHSSLKSSVILFMKRALFFLKRKIFIITLILFISTITCQIFVLMNVTTAIGWDVGGVISNVSNPSRINDYLSVYPNNQLYFFIMYFYNIVISSFSPELSGQWIIFQIFNIILIDVAALILYMGTKGLFNKKVAYLSLYLYMGLFMLSPWIMVPYTDQISLLLVTIVLYLYSNLKNISGLPFLLTVIVLGIIIGVSFLIKPSSIIYAVAWAIMKIIKYIERPYWDWKNIILSGLVVISFCLPLIIFDHFMSNQEIVKIDSKKAMPWTHFVMMGLSGNGGYNADDVKRDKDIKDPALRKESNVDIIKQRLRNHKPYGYTAFLIQKHFNNTDRGDFGWGTDGTPQIPKEKSKNRIQSFLRDLYYQQGKKTSIIRFCMQVIWLIIIIGLIYSHRINKDHFIVFCMKLTIIGAFLYLLLFEGGRSRYLIQYLPFFLIISSNGLISWLNSYSNRIERFSI